MKQIFKSFIKRWKKSDTGFVTIISATLIKTTHPVIFKTNFFYTHWYSGKEIPHDFFRLN